MADSAKINVWQVIDNWTSLRLSIQKFLSIVSDTCGYTLVSYQSSIYRNGQFQSFVVPTSIIFIARQHSSPPSLINNGAKPSLEKRRPGGNTKLYKDPV